MHRATCWKTALTLLFSVKPGDVRPCGVRQRHVPVSRGRRQAGFTLLELLMLLAVIGIMAGLAVFTISGALSGLRANKEMHQIIASLREARMLAMSQDRMVSLRFPASAGINNEIEVRIWDRDAAGPDKWVIIGVDAAQRRTDPSMILGNNYRFSRSEIPAAVPGEGELVVGDKVIFNGTEVAPGNNRFVFTQDGFLANISDVDSPINGTIYIGAPDGNQTLARAVTIRGATGNITVWQRRKDSWKKVG